MGPSEPPIPLLYIELASRFNEQSHVRFLVELGLCIIK